MHSSDLGIATQSTRACAEPRAVPAMRKSQSTDLAANCEGTLQRRPGCLHSAPPTWELSSCCTCAESGFEAVRQYRRYVAVRHLAVFQFRQYGYRLLQVYGLTSM